MIFNPKDYSVIFLSYDEPNCEENYQHLLTLCPDAQRVHGVKGSDTAHKECARLSKTENVIIVDGDNFVKPEFFTKTFNLVDSVDLSTSVLSYSAFNPVNGNCYGNGGIKVWPVSKLLSMQTHENAPEGTSVDFDFKNYLELNFVGSITDITASPLQAFKAGFREGSKLCMENNQIVTYVNEINWKNYERLWRWMHIGGDVTNGLWAIYGARMGYYMSMVHRGDFSKIKDADHLKAVFNESTFNLTSLFTEVNKLTPLIKNGTVDDRITDILGIEESKDFREKIPYTVRSEQNFIKYQYNEPPQVFFIGSTEKNYQRLLTKEPKALKASSYLDAAKQATTDYFWAIDENQYIVDRFDFEFNIPFYAQAKNRIWCNQTDSGHSENGVKLLHRFSTIINAQLPVESIFEISCINE
jgi:hypothetical protein